MRAAAIVTGLAATVMSLAAAAWAAPANAQDACARLMFLKLPDTTITEARTIPAGEVKVRPPAPGPDLTANLPAHCRVTGSIRPTADSDIRFEVWLPVSGWNRRYQQVGNGGLAGSIWQFAMVDPLLRGSATAATDDGHATSTAFDGGWAIGHPEKLIDYGYRAVHLTALAGQAIVQAYYGQKARHTYFVGCSDGGRESLMEAQRFPQDFEGYLVGAPGIDVPNNEVAHLYVWQSLHALGPGGQITPLQLAALSAKVLQRCDALDGVKDGVLRDPRQCPFKATEASCSGRSDGACLTAAQATAVQRIYDGVRDPRTGAQIAPGHFVTMGAEAVVWPVILLDTPEGPSLGQSANQGVIGALLYGDPNLDMSTVDVVKAAGDAKTKLAPIINSDSPDLRAARKAGRKILQFHGWADPNIPPQYSIAYFEAVQRFLASDTQDFYRLFLVPGMAHCIGGVGPTSLGGIGVYPGLTDPRHDWVSALERWVEDGVAPGQMIGTEFQHDPASPSGPISPGTAIKSTRPLCPYPKVAVYAGQGGTDDAANFRCAAPPG
jgi:feruloyl esterase